MKKYFFSLLLLVSLSAYAHEITNFSQEGLAQCYAARITQGEDSAAIIESLIAKINEMENNNSINASEAESLRAYVKTLAPAEAPCGCSE